MDETHQELILPEGSETHISIHDSVLSISQPGVETDYAEVGLNFEQAKALAAFLNNALKDGAL